MVSFYDSLETRGGDYMTNDRLNLLRKTLKISQEEFDNRLGVTGASISRLEKG
ncbi:MAG: helix-turn-helix transcriptional regulator, partial [Lachnospiraceae bacterium]